METGVEMGRKGLNYCAVFMHCNHLTIAQVIINEELGSLSAAKLSVCQFYQDCIQKAWKDFWPSVLRSLRGLMCKLVICTVRPPGNWGI